MFKHIVRVLVSLIFIGTSTLLAQSSTPDTSYQLLWRIDRADLPQPSFLFGTIHLRDARVFEFPDSVLASLYTVEQIALEVSPDQLSELSAMETRPSIRYRRRIQDVIDREQFLAINTTSKLLLGENLRSVQLSDLPDLRGRLTRPTVRAGDRPTFMDGHLAFLASGWGQAVTGLEPVEVHHRQDYIPDSADVLPYLRRMIHAALESNAQQEELLSLYLKGNMQELADYLGSNDDTPYDRWMHYRNLIMSDSLVQLIAQRPTFAAVGAGHLVGDSGMVALLRDRGFTLTAIPAMRTGRYAYFEELDRDKAPWVPLDFSQFGFRLEVPAQPEQDAGADSDPDGDMGISIDITSGIQTIYIHTNMPDYLEGLSGDSMYERLVDNMVSRIWQTETQRIVDQQETIEVDGVEGREFWLKGTKEEESIRLQAFKRDERLYLFLGLAQSRPLDDPLIERFFNSIEFVEVPGMKAAYMFADSSRTFFKVAMPFKPEYDFSTREGDGVTSNAVHRYSANDVIQDVFYSVTSLRLAPGRFFLDDSTSLQGMIDKMQQNMRGAELSVDSLFASEFSYPGVSYLMEGGRKLGKYRLRAILRLRGNTTFIQLAIGPPERVSGAEGDRFFDSFAFLPVQPPKFDVPYFPEDSSFRLLFPGKVLRDEEARYSVVAEEITPLLAADSMSNVAYHAFELALSPYLQVPHPDSLFTQVIADFLLNTEAGDSIAWTRSMEWQGCPTQDGYLVNANRHVQIRFRQVWTGAKLILLLIYETPEFTGPAYEAFFDSLQVFRIDTSLYTQLQSPLLSRLIDAVYEAPDSTVRSVARRLARYEPLPEDTLLIQQGLARSIDALDREREVKAELVDMYVAASQSSAVPFFMSELRRTQGDHPALLRMGLDIQKEGTEAQIDTLWQYLTTYTPHFRTYQINRSLTLLQKRGLMGRHLPAILAITDSTWQRQVVSWLSGQSDLDAFDLNAHPGIIAAIDSVAQAGLMYVQEQRSLKQRYPDSALHISTWRYEPAISLLPTLPVSAERESLMQSFLQGRDFKWLQFELVERRLSRGMEVSQEVIDHLAQDMYYRFPIYTVLDTTGNLSRMPKAYGSPEALIQGYIYEYEELEGVQESEIQVLASFKYKYQGQKSRGYLVSVDDGSGPLAYLCGFFTKKGKPIGDLWVYSTYQSIDARTPKEHIERLTARWESEQQSLKGK